MIDYRAILENVADGVYIVDRERRITFWNPGATEISGHEAAAVLGHSCATGPLQHVDALGNRLCETECPLTKVLGDGQPRGAEIFLHHKDGHLVPVRVAVRPLRSAAGELVGAVETFIDITPLLEAQRRSAELERLSLIDALTGLGNRRFAERQLDIYLAEQSRYDRSFGMLFLDIDLFKNVNDTWGHEVGDSVLRMVARTLAGAARGEDFVSRWGGEEFVVLVRESDTGALEAVADRIRRMIEASSFAVGEAQIKVTVSIGAAVAKANDTASDLFRRADVLLYESKRAGRNRVTVA